MTIATMQQDASPEPDRNDLERELFGPASDDDEAYNDEMAETGKESPRASRRLDPRRHWEKKLIGLWMDSGRTRVMLHPISCCNSS